MRVIQEKKNDKYNPNSFGLELLGLALFHSPFTHKLDIRNFYLFCEWMVRFNVLINSGNRKNNTIIRADATSNKLLITCTSILFYNRALTVDFCFIGQNWTNYYNTINMLLLYPRIVIKVSILPSVLPSFCKAESTHLSPINPSTSLNRM